MCNENIKVLYILNVTISVVQLYLLFDNLGSEASLLDFITIILFLEWTIIIILLCRKCSCHIMWECDSFGLCMRSQIHLRCKEIMWTLITVFAVKELCTRRKLGETIWVSITKVYTVLTRLLFVGNRAGKYTCCVGSFNTQNICRMYLLSWNSGCCLWYPLTLYEHGSINELW